MRARQATRHAIFPLIVLMSAPITADDQPTPPAKKAQAPASPTTSAVPPATQAEATRARFSVQVRLKELDVPESKDRPGTKALREVLEARLRLLEEWDRANREREAAEHPEVSPERESAAIRAEAEKAKALLDRSEKAPDALLPGAFQAATESGKPPAARLEDMKEAIDTARAELKERSEELEKLRAEGSRAHASEIATLRAGRDKAYQACAAQEARRGEREAAIQSATAAEARELARERLTNDEWESRVESTRLATMDSRVALEMKRIDLGSARFGVKATRVLLGKRLVERMENRYATLAEGQRVELQKAVASEQNRALRTGDTLERFRAKRTAELLELEAQVIAYEKTNATSGGLSIADQTSLADAASDDFAQLQKLLADGNVSPLDVLRLRNDFRRIIPERSLVIRTDLAASSDELTAYENALTDAEIDLVNDARDDRFERDALLEQLEKGRRDHARTILDELEVRHKTLMIRRRDVLTKLSRRSEDVYNQILRRIDILDKHYAFIRTHIFWVRDAEPLGPATVARARDESIRTAKGLVKIALEPWDRSLWGRITPEFVLVIAAMVVLPWPLHLARKALDRHHLAGDSNEGLSLADFR